MNPRFIRAYRFFRANAGGCDGLSAAWAFDLAKSEEQAAQRGWTVAWEYEVDPGECECDAVSREQLESGEVEAMCAVLRDETGATLASIGACLFCAYEPAWVSRNHRRVIEAELANEALWNLEGRERALSRQS